MAVIYGLTDPRTQEVRYIGKANDARERFKSHLRDARRRRSPLYDWMGKLARDGLVPGVVVLEECVGDWRSAERRLIAEGRARGDRLLNLADGGDEPFCPAEVRAANGRRNAIARQADPFRRRLWELKRDIGAILRSGYASNEARAKLRRAAALAPHLFGQYANIPDRIEA